MTPQTQTPQTTLSEKIISVKLIECLPIKDVRFALKKILERNKSLEIKKDLDSNSHYSEVYQDGYKDGWNDALQESEEIIKFEMGDDLI